MSNSRPQIKVSVAPAFAEFFRPRPNGYKVFYGGRGSGKSESAARGLICEAARREIRVLCAREYQNSMRDSVHSLLAGTIEGMGLGPWFEVQENTIICKSTGSDFLFRGLHHNPVSLQSLHGITHCWVEEAQTVPDRSWSILLPSIRGANPEVWVTFNPDLETDSTYKRWVLNPPPEAYVRKVSWRDNPWLPENLRRQKDHLAKVDPEAYAHVWEGDCRRNSAAQILLGKFVIEDFTPAIGWDGPYYGADWGFSQDPTTLVKLWIHDRKLFVEHEAYKVGCDLDDTPALFDRVPGSREYAIRADSARPETISHMQRHGFPKITGVEKWKGSVEDGIAHLRQYEQIVIHPRCRNAAEEARLYSYKINRLSGDVLPDIVDKHNHIIDAIRYALAPLIRRVGMGFYDFMRQEADALKAQQTGN